MKKQANSIVLTAALGALTVLMGITGVGLIPLPVASLTIMHIPVIIGAIFAGPVCGAGVGFIFGLFSLVKAVIAPAASTDPFFVNPLISVLPRILLGLSAWALYYVFKRREYLAIIISAFVGTLLHTVYVMTALVIAKAVAIKVALWVFITNGLPEAIAATLITIAVISAWRGIDGHVKKSRLEDITSDSDSDTPLQH